MLDNIKAFQMVVECQGFRSAAREMKLSPAMVSRRVEQLEFHLKAQLIKRNSRQIALTPAGERFYRHSVQIISQYEFSLRDVKSLNDELSGTLKVGIPHSINHLHVIPQLHQFRQNYPQLQLEIVTGNHHMQLFSHGFDLALHCGPLPDCNLYYSLLGHWRKHTCLSPEYARQNGVPTHPGQLHQHRCLLHVDNHRRSWNYRIDGISTDICLEPAARINNSLDLCQMVRHGEGISYLPHFTLKPWLDAGEILSVLDNWMPAPLPMYIVYVNPQPSLKEKAFIDFIRSLDLGLVPLASSIATIT